MNAGAIRAQQCAAGQVGAVCKHSDSYCLLWWGVNSVSMSGGVSVSWMFLATQQESCHLHLFTFGWPKMNGVYFLPLTPSPHFSVVAPHLHVHFSQFLPKGIFFLFALLTLLLHLGAQRRVAIVHQFADLCHRRIGQYLYNRGDLRLKANTVRHHRQVCLLLVHGQMCAAGGCGCCCGSRAGTDPHTEVWPVTCKQPRESNSQVCVSLMCPQLLWFFKARESPPDDVSLLSSITSQAATWANMSRETERKSLTAGFKFLCFCGLIHWCLHIPQRLFLQTALIYIYQEFRPLPHLTGDVGPSNFREWLYSEQKKIFLCSHILFRF